MVKVLVTKENWKALKAYKGLEKENFILSCVHITKDHIEVTNGRTLLRISSGKTGINVPEGVYKAIAENKHNKIFVEVVLEKIDGEYPRTDIFFNDLSKLSKKHCGQVTDEVSISRLMLNLFEYTGNAFSYKYLKDLSGLSVQWEMHKGKKNNPCMLSAKDYNFLCMPFVYDPITVASH